MSQCRFSLKIPSTTRTAPIVSSTTVALTVNDSSLMRFRMASPPELVSPLYGEGRRIVQARRISGMRPSTGGDKIDSDLNVLFQGGGFMRATGKVLLMLSLLAAVPTG